MTVTALVLAAGRSRRMGAAKAFLELNGEPLLSRILRTAFVAGVDRAVVVVGSAADPKLASRAAVQELLADRHPTLANRVRVIVGEPDKTPIDSIRAGLREVEAGSAVLLWPVDHPFAERDLVHDLIERLAGTPDRIALPSLGGRGGHPVLLGADVVRELTSPAADRGADAVVNRDRLRLCHVEVRDPRLFAALNTPDEAAALAVRLPVPR